MLVGIFCMFSCFFLAFPETNLNHLGKYFLRETETVWDENPLV